jgi:hypothetical protein
LVLAIRLFKAVYGAEKMVGVFSQVALGFLRASKRSDIEIREKSIIVDSIWISRGLAI